MTGLGLGVDCSFLTFKSENDFFKFLRKPISGGFYWLTEVCWFETPPNLFELGSSDGLFWADCKVSL